MGTIRLFRQYIPVSYLFLAFLELWIFISSLYLGVMLGLHFSFNQLLQYVGILAPEAFFFSLIMLLSLASVGLYQRRLKEGRSGVILRILIGVVVGVLVINQISYTLPELDMGNSVWLTVIAISFIGIFIARMILFKALKTSALRRRVLVLGAGSRAKKLKENIKNMGNYVYDIAGFIPLVDEGLGVSSNLILVMNTDLLRVVKEQDIDEIIIAVDSNPNSFPTESLVQCKLFGVPVTDIVSFYERETGKIMIDSVSPSWFIFADGFQRGVWQKKLKRLSDLLLSVLLGVISAPAMVIVALLIWLESGCSGPILYRQMRVGANGQNFQLLKFRSMQLDAEKNGPQWANLNDHRITAIGRFIRRSRLDELPQLLNVIKGEMSFVGPRPERPEFVRELKDKIPFYQERHALKPGITGWAQVCYPYGSSIQDAYEKLQYDLYYVKNYSLFLDFVILLQTLEVVLLSRGSR